MNQISLVIMVHFCKIVELAGEYNARYLVLDYPGAHFQHMFHEKELHVAVRNLLSLENTSTSPYNIISGQLRETHGQLAFKMPY